MEKYLIFSNIVWQYYSIVLKYNSDPVAKSAIAPPCHGGDRGFEPHQGRQKIYCIGK